jgi:Spy/CpxP family protein refolding chaperone
MTSYRSILSTVLLASSLAVLAAPAVAAPDYCGHRGGRGDYFEHRGERMEHHHKKLLDALKLSPDQALAWEKFIASKGSLPMSMDAAHSEDWSKLTSPERADKALEMMKEHQARMGEHIVALKEFYSVLTPEQKKTFDEFHAAPPRGKHGKHHHRHSGMDSAAPK